MRKYYNLIRWINEVARKDFSIAEIEEEYKCLYHDYINQYKIHKMKYKMGVIETIVNAGIDMLSGPIDVGPIKALIGSVN